MKKEKYPIELDLHLRIKDLREAGVGWDEIKEAADTEIEKQKTEERKKDEGREL